MLAKKIFMGALVCGSFFSALSFADDNDSVFFDEDMAGFESYKAKPWNANKMILQRSACRSAFVMSLFLWRACAPSLAYSHIALFVVVLKSHQLNVGWLSINQ